MNPLETKLHPQAIEFIRHHGMDDCSRGDDEFYDPLSSSHKRGGAK